MTRATGLCSSVILVLALGAAASGDESPLPGQDALPSAPPVLRLTVGEAVARALATSPLLARLGALQTAAEAEERGARAERWPQLELGAAYVRRSEVPELQIVSPSQDPDQPIQLVTIYPNIQDNWRLRAGLAWPVYTGGQIDSRIEAAQQGRSAAQHDRGAARDDLIFEVKAAYWALVSARENTRVFTDAIRSFEAHLEDTRNLERFGMAARNDVLAVQVKRDRAELNRLQAEVSAEIAEANLRRLLGLSPRTRVEAVEPLGSAPPAGLDIDALVAEAGAARPDRAALVARIAAGEAIVGAEHGRRLPQLAVTGGYFYANPNRDIVPPEAAWKDTWDIGVSLTWSVFDGGRRSAAEARARAEADAAHEQLRELDRAIRLEVTRRVLELRTAEKRVDVAAQVVESAKESLRVASDRFREGLIPSSELLDAEVDLERAGVSRTEALAELRLAAAGLDRAVGR